MKKQILAIQKTITSILLIVMSVSVKTQMDPNPTHINFGIAEGLPSHETYKIIQDSKGYIWISTDRGVCRYNGYEFTVYTEKHGLSDNTVFDIYEDYKGRIWFITFSLKLSYYENGEIKLYPYNSTIQKLLKNQSYIKTSFIIDKHESIYLGTKGGYFKIDSLGLTEHILENIEPGIHINQVDSTYFFFGKKTIRPEIAYHLESTKKDTTYQMTLGDKDIPPVNVSVIGEVPNLIIGEGNRIHQINSNYEFTTEYLENRVISLTQDVQQNLWVGNYKGGLIFYPKGQITDSSQTKWFSDKSISSIFHDNQGGTWLSTLENGIYYIPSTRFLTYSTQTGLSENIISLLKLGADNKLFMGTSQGMLHELDISSNTLTQKDLNITSESVNSITALEFDSVKNTLWIASIDGVFKLNNNQFLQLPNKENITGYSGFAFGENDTIWRSHSSGLFQFYKDSLVLPPRKENKHLRVSSLYLEYDKGIWIGNLNGLSFYDKSKLKYLGDEHFLLSQRIVDIKNWKNQLILATRSGGIVIKSKDSIYDITEADGLSSNLVTSIFSKKDDLWVGTNKGLNRITELDGKLKISNYSTENGLVSNQINDIEFTKDNGFVATNFGVTIFDIPTSNKEVKIPVYISNWLLNGKNLKMDSIYFLKHNQNNIQIKFEALDFHKRNPLLYRYQLQGADTGWIYTESRFVNYPVLPPGEYKFNLEAKNYLGQWTPSDSLIQFTIKPPFWKTWWFLSIILTGFCAILFFIFRFNIITYNRSAVSYLIKVIADRLGKNDYLLIKDVSNGATVKIGIHSILWIQSQQHYIKIHLDGKQIKCRMTFQNILEQLNQHNNFVKVHRSYIVNTFNIEGVGPNFVQIKGQVIPVSKKHLPVLNKIKKTMRFTSSPEMKDN